MTDPTPMEVPGGLRGLAAHDPGVIDLLRDLRVALEARSGLDEQTIELVRLGTLIGLGAPPDALTSHVRRLRSLGAGPDQVWGAVLAVIPLVGVPRLVAAGAAIDAALREDNAGTGG